MTPEAWGWVSLTQTTGKGWFPQGEIREAGISSGRRPVFPFHGVPGRDRDAEPRACAEKVPARCELRDMFPQSVFGGWSYF